MSFDSLFFLFCFLPVLLAVHRIIPPRGRQYVLIVFSLLFYAFASPFLPLFLGGILLNALLGWLLDKARARPRLSGALLLCGVLFNVGLLVYYKYRDFLLPGLAASLSAVQNTAIPLGLSFFTFKAISLLVDIRRGTVPAFDFSRTVCYLSFFGQITSGPIARYNEFTAADPAQGSLFGRGVERFMLGFCKKILLADILANVVAEVFETPSPATALVWLGSVCYSLQLYYDFSSYSDMAVGLCHMLGYRCPENFDYPYMTRSFSEFWRRWHITLGHWFRDYVYIPLGGSRVCLPRVYLNLLAVWLLTGLWHGANWTFVAWGLGHFVLIALEKASGLPGRFRRPWACGLYRVFVLVFINFLWVVFRSSDIAQAQQMLLAMLGFAPGAAGSARALFLLRDYGVFVAAGLLFTGPVLPWLSRLVARLSAGKRTPGHIANGAAACALAVLFVCALSFVVGGQNNPFLYGNF